MNGCEVMFDAAGAQRMQELVEESTGKPCPCKSGQRCPILPRVLAVVPAAAVGAVAMAAAESATRLLTG